ncbi:MAG: ATP-dependent helicase [Gracilimonas sp.]|uniref:ATP-dependent helicase n=1 Tax=Gracilimonas TaxID=649462 RepID=UPI001B169D0A|nr:ATP-dependent helicase [Gracilimonas sp.]MBO6586422.1 ATP-dependent helicase [Gracilimonas sp.]MBO6615079.1 ATP-dependent helicase [Gracilimonas sp.]
MKKFVLKKEEPRKRPEDYSIPYADLLNKQQLDAVFHEKGPALVVAGAGTGKTRTLVHRVARLVESGVKPSNILLLTFTRRAAKEMLNRASNILDERCKQVQGGTFHFYCSLLLHRHSEIIGYPSNFTIIDTADALEVIQFVRTELKLNKKKKRFPNKNTLLNIISTCINKHLDLRVVLQEQYPQFLEQEEKIEQVGLAYHEYKEKNYVMDFDDLLIKTRQLLTQHEDIRIKVASQNQFVMVDEFQDTNKLQAELTELFSSVHGNVMAVGDDAQSIYSFRGADHQNIMDFPERFEGTKLIKLEENYRSTPQILNVANNLLNQASFKFDKQLYSEIKDGELPALVQSSSEHDQSRFITQAVLQLREQEMELNEMAVLFRNGRDSFDLEVELNRKNIPFVKYGGQKFTEAAHIKDVLAHIRVLVNPMDTIAWNRVLMLLDGIGPKTAQDLFEWIRLAKNPYRLDLSDTTSQSYIDQLKVLSKLLIALKENDHSVAKVVELVVDYYRDFCKDRYDDYPKRLKDLEAFINVSESFTSLPKMLEELALDPITATAVDTEQKTKEEAPLILSTIHSAKGLEWKHVFIIQCLDGIIPSAYSVEEEEQLDEELRLLYVAATRAKDMLYFSYPVLAQSAYGDYFTQPSRFLKDMNNDLVEEWKLVEEEQQQQIEDGNQQQLTD